MSRHPKVIAPNALFQDNSSLRRRSLDERFITQLLTQTPQDQVEGQEFRQIMMKALQSLTPEELKAIELRHQHKKSPGQAAAQLHLSRDQLKALEDSAIDKLKSYLAIYDEL